MSLIRNEEAIELHTTDYNAFARIWEKNYLWGFDRIWELKSCVRGKRREVASCLQSNPKSFLPQTFNCQLPLTLMHSLFNISQWETKKKLERRPSQVLHVSAQPTWLPDLDCTESVCVFVLFIFVFSLLVFLIFVFVCLVPVFLHLAFVHRSVIDWK